MLSAIIGAILFISTTPGFLFPPVSKGMQPAQAVPDTLLVKQLLKSANEDVDLGELARAKPKIKRASALADSLDYEYGKALVAVRRADVYLVEQQIDSAILVASDALDQFPESKLRVQMYNMLATGYNYKNRAREAIEAYKKGMELIHLEKEDGRARTAAAIRLNMASAYMNLGEQAQAFENYISALNQAEASKDTLFLVIILNNLGDSYNSIEAYDKADFYLSKALNISTKKSYKSELLRINQNLAITRFNQDRLDESLELYNRALELAAELRPNTPPFRITYNLGMLYAKMGEYDTAEARYKESIGYCEEMNIPQGLYFNYVGLGELYFNTNRPVKAREWYQKALEEAEKINSLLYQKEVLEKLYIVHKEAGYNKRALSFLESFKAISDSLSSKEESEALAKLQSELEVDRQTQINKLLEEKQEQQEGRLKFQLILIIGAIVVIVIILISLYLVRKSNKEKGEINDRLILQKKELEEVNKAKDKLFAIIAHDLRSPLGSMNAILYLIKNSDLSMDEMRKLANELEASVQKNVDAMEDLLAWAREQMSGVSMEIKPIRLKTVIEDVLSKQAFQIEKKEINVQNKVSGNVELQADQNALKLIIRNLISNSIKFTPNGGSITVSEKVIENKVRISISDTGVGIPQEIRDQIFAANSWSRTGTNKEKGSGFGLSLSKEFTERMGGEIDFESHVGKGTAFFIELPKA